MSKSALPGTEYRDGVYFCWKIRVGGRGAKPIVVKRRDYNAYKKAVQAKIEELTEKGYLEPSKDELTVGQYLERWLDIFVKPNREHGTYRSYRLAVRNHIAPPAREDPDQKADPQGLAARVAARRRGLGKKKLSKLTSMDVQAMVNDLTAAGSNRTAIYAVQVLSRALNSAVRQGILLRNVCLAVKTPEPAPPRDRVLPTEEVEKLLAELYKRTELKTRPGEWRYLYRDRHVIKFALNAGVRISEALGILRVMVDFDANLVSIKGQLEVRGKGEWEVKPFTKTKKPRVVPMTPGARQALLEQLAMVADDERKAGKGYVDNSLVFATESGAPMSARNVLRSMERACAAAGIPDATTHDLRRSFGTHLAAVEDKLHVVADILGDNIMTAKKYYVWADTALKQTAVAKLTMGSSQEAKTNEREG